ncbi:MATE family efflux transporter [Rhodopirellula halodulae]|uniref:MATE family efflux transporter n=1 Tax=Rhodopirellula halodulae TaxID=2894198 RepID=UPI001E412772|nr:MATE family efflux transporter [Rhodopirellula sp. JC737]MCC9658414.1 MATE family efflux transporter [Rhodopirellula sp. JC737]
MLQSPNRSKNDAFGYRAMVSVAIPLAATVGCFSLTLFTDRTLLMWYGPTSSAASMAAGNLYWAIACIPVTAMGFITPLAAMALGKKRNRGAVAQRVWSLLWQCVWFTLACVPAFALIGWASPLLFQGFGHAAELADQEAKYFRTLLLVAPASMLEAGLTAFFVGRRVTRPILRTNLASSALNVALDVWFIFGGLGLPAMGVFGAALATTVSMWFKVAVFLTMLLRLKSFARHRSSAWKPRRQLMREIVGPGAAIGLQQLIRSGLFSFVLLVIGAASVTGLAATSAALTLYQLLSIPAIGLGTAITVVTGQALASNGIGLASETIRRGMTLGVAVALALAMILVLFPDALLQIPLGGVDAAERADIQPLAVQLMRYAAVYGLVDVASLLLAASMKGIGKSFSILIATAVPGIAVVGLGWLLVPGGSFSSATVDDATVVTYWWSALVIWSAAQSAILAGSLFFTTKQSSEAMLELG